MSKRQIFIFGIPITLLVIIVILLGIVWRGSRTSERPYYIVYFTSGEMYVGHVSTFPFFKLTDAYLLHVAPAASDSAKNNIQLTPLKSAIWAPQKLYVNRDQVIFYGPLANDSKVMEAIPAKKNTASK